MTGRIWLSRSGDYESHEEDLERVNLCWISEKVAWNTHRQLGDVRLPNRATLIVFFRYYWAELNLPTASAL